MNNYYEILKIEPTSSAEDIKKAYLDLIREYHPDTYNGDKTFAERQTELITEAYTILKDESTRKKYDLSRPAINIVKEEKTSKTISTNIKEFVNKLNTINRKHNQDAIQKINSSRKLKRLRNLRNIINFCIDLGITILISLIIIFLIYCFKR